MRNGSKVFVGLDVHKDSISVGVAQQAVEKLLRRPKPGKLTIVATGAMRPSPRNGTLTNIQGS